MSMFRNLMAIWLLDQSPKHVKCVFARTEADSPYAGVRANSRRLRVAYDRDSGVTYEQLRHFLSRVQRDPALKRQLEEATTADEVARLAQLLGFSVSGSEILRFSGQSAAGVRVRRIDHPGEYPGRYY